MEPTTFTVTLRPLYARYVIQKGLELGLTPEEYLAMEFEYELHYEAVRHAEPDKEGDDD